jgi:hypothetical protein
MVYFKLKSYVVKMIPIAGKSGIETYVKVGIGE